MKLHELKILYKYYVNVLLGNKTFELRKNDRDYQVGDLIHFIIVDKNNIEKSSLVDMILSKNNVYQITYVLKDVEEYGLDKDYCILGIKKLYESK